MNKDTLLTRLEESREAFLDTFDDLPDELLLKPGVAGDWSLKDLLAHLTMWEAELIKLLFRARSGQPPGTAHFQSQPREALNAQWAQTYRLRPLDQVLEDFHGIRQQTIRRVEPFSEADLANPKRFKWLNHKPLWKWITQDSCDHETGHAADILAWRASLGV